MINLDISESSLIISLPSFTQYPFMSSFKMLPPKIHLMIGIKPKCCFAVRRYLSRT